MHLFLLRGAGHSEEEHEQCICRDLMGAERSPCACRDSDIAEDIEPESVQPLGNYAVQITWKDGFNQVSTIQPLYS